MEIFPVNDKTTEEEFYKVPNFIYKNDKNYIQPLLKDVKIVFDKTKNKAYRFGETKRWVIKDDGKLTGRIAAFINKKYKNKNDEFPVGGIGFFECINNQDAADLLFDNAKHWLISKGMEAMDGPINFGERDRWWGLVTEGFHPPLYCMNYNLPYYKFLFENYGFKLFYEQICLFMDPKKELPQKIRERHKQISENKDFHYELINKKNIEKYALDFTTVYNKAWAGHGGLKQLDKSQVIKMFKQMKPVMDENIISFSYYKNEPVALFVNLPDLNQWFKYLKGKFGLLQKLYFLYLKTFVKNKKFTGIVFGVVPEWQGKGVDAYLIGESSLLIRSDKVPYTEYEMQWIGDFNPKMLNVAEGLGEVKRNRTLTTYRYIFDRTKEFKRHPLLA